MQYVITQEDRESSWPDVEQRVSAVIDRVSLPPNKRQQFIDAVKLQYEWTEDQFARWEPMVDFSDNQVRIWQKLRSNRRSRTRRP